MWVTTQKCDEFNSGERIFLFYYLTLPVRASDKRITCEEEFSDSEDEGEGRRDRTSFKPRLKKPRTEEDKKDTEKGGV